MGRLLGAWVVVVLAGCGPEVPGHPAPSEAEGASRSDGVAIPGPWKPSATLLATGDRQRVSTTPTPRTNGACTSTNPWACSCGSHPACSSGLPGARELGAYLKRRFPQISSLGGLGSCCRQATNSPDFLSPHSMGRAIDLMIPELGGDADNTKGDPIVAFLIENAQAIGVQYVAWDRAQWRAASPPGQRWSTLRGSYKHTDHIHVDINLDGANRRTPFFRGGAVGGGASCTAQCNGTVVVRADCATGDCAAYGATCIADPNPRCVFPACPPNGTGKVCLDDFTIADCRDGVVTGRGNCGMFGSYCSTAGVLPTAARCVLSLCVPGPTAVPEASMRCSITAGRRLECDENGVGRELPCPAGEICSVLDGEAGCVAPLAECPVPPAGAPADDREVCLPDGRVARCFNGNVIAVDDCGPGATCTTLGGDPHCASTACLAGGGRASVCNSPSERATCDATGMEVRVEDCPAGTACVEDGSGAACAASCGDGTCRGGETCANCEADCGPCSTCGDGRCGVGETCLACEADCGACATCGDGACEGGEGCETCEEDCGRCSGCGDRVCGGGETCRTCRADCGWCPDAGGEGDGDAPATPGPAGCGCDASSATWLALVPLAFARRRARAALALAGCAALACGGGTVVVPPRVPPPAADAGVDAVGACGPACERTTLVATFGGKSRPFEHAGHGFTAAANSASGARELYLEAYEGGDPGCPTETSAQTTMTLIVAGVRPAFDASQSSDSGLKATLLDFSAGLTDDLPARATSVTLVHAGDCLGCPDEAVRFDLDASFAGGRVRGRVVAARCPSLDDE